MFSLTRQQGVNQLDQVPRSRAASLVYLVSMTIYLSWEMSHMKDGTGSLHSKEMCLNTLVPPRGMWSTEHRHRGRPDTWGDRRQTKHNGRIRSTIAMVLALYSWKSTSFSALSTSTFKAQCAHLQQHNTPSHWLKERRRSLGSGQHDNRLYFEQRMTERQAFFL